MKMKSAPLFQTSVAACKWAMRYAYEQYDMSPTAKIVGGCALGSGRGLFGLDGAGQAGMVLREIENLSRFDLAFIVATCAPRTFDCKCGAPCCRHWRQNPMWESSIEFICEFALARTGLEFTNLRLRRMLVEKHFGIKHKYTEIADSADVHRTTATKQFKLLTKGLAAVEYPIWVRFDAGLEEIGMTGPEFQWENKETEKKGDEEMAEKLPNPKYVAIWGVDSVTVWVDDMWKVVTYATVVPIDGSVNLSRAVGGRIVGKTIRDLQNPKWTQETLWRSLSMAFGPNDAGPYEAIRSSCPQDLAPRFAKS